MSSASEKLMATMRAKREAMCTYKALPALPKGQLFEITKFDHTQSMYENAEKKKPYVLVPHFSYAGINMKTYFPGEFTDIDEETIMTMKQTFNDNIKEGIRIRFAYYGQMAGQNIVKLHFNNEGIDEDKLREVQEWQKKSEESGSPYNSPYKRQRTDSPSPAKGYAKRNLYDN